MDDEMIARRVFTSHAKGGSQVPAKSAARMLRECGLPLTEDESASVLKQNGPSFCNANMSVDDFIMVLKQARTIVGDARATVVSTLRELNLLRGIDSDYIAPDALRSALQKFGNTGECQDIQDMMETIKKGKLVRNAQGHVHIESFVTEILLL
mmetsp:Transcript_1743/g.4094  ORF Transcript_1743/g.4094 Transcript_1743/m.4094 type:complete len:153 (-) Transcript_1743:176-634(-)|eukprot:CAMPEP_0171489454 /NCGR_PEP_ID=MMETSP0958-20121227/2766_1 /TAXON_ID=87120 /ORGANISM="Aurantiochytrium limacinum, Strain ATCCMYA-1381" /LENGTH=152 /DNA_ID=CAMNT_0012022669 /DNA_START=754 /DNA_END=1212 /DNA_ORIENTATION=-